MCTKRGLQTLSKRVHPARTTTYSSSSSSSSSTLSVGQPRNADVRAELAGEVTESLAAAGLVARGHDLIAENLTTITKDTPSDSIPSDSVQLSKKNADDGDKLCLKTWNEMPKHLQFNPHIRTGYRPLTDAWGCLASLFYLHNETVNIVTHGLAIIYILFIIPSRLPWWEPGVFMGVISWCHLIGAASPWIGSFIYHLFMSSHYGAGFYRNLLKLDMLGIWVCQSVGAMPMIAASVHCLPSVLWHFCILLYVFLSLWGLLKAMRAKSPWERRLCFSPPFMMRMIFLTLRCFRIGSGATDKLTHFILQDLVAVIGGIIGALRIPEKWLPGQVDFYLNSHNIMHVIVVTAVWSMHAATMQDIHWMMEPTACQATSSSTPLHDEL